MQVNNALLVRALFSNSAGRARVAWLAGFASARADGSAAVVSGRLRTVSRSIPLDLAEGVELASVS